MSRSWWIAFVFASGAGLIGVGIVSLWRANEDAQRIVAAERHRAARERARAVRDLVLDPRLYKGGPREQEFARIDGRIVVPPAYALWLDAVPELDEPAAPALEAAWSADRDENTAARDVALASVREPTNAREARSWLLLHARAQRALPAWAEEWLRRSAPERAEALLDRIREHAPAFDSGTLRTAVAEVARWKENLRVARAVVTQMNGPSGARVHEGKLVVWIDGYGVLVEPLDESLAALRRQSSLAGSGELTTRAEREDAIPALDGALFVLPAPPGAPALGGPLGLGALLLALALCFAFGSFFAIRALRRESAAMTARAEFLTSVTHELRTPLAGIRLLAEMLDEGRVPESKRAEYHRMIASETLRLSSLIENVLDLGRIERGERAYDLRVHDLGAIVREVAELFELVAARDRMTLQVASNATEAQVDRGACVQALLNVLDNARKYAAAGQRIEITQEGNEVVVRDFGPGVPADERERIFARFQRGTAQQDGSVPGLGLGLHLARAIMLAHGGTLACEAPRDGGPGAAFVFRFAEAR